MSDLLYRIQSRLGDDAAVLWDTVAGTLDTEHPELSWDRGEADWSFSTTKYGPTDFGFIMAYGRVVAAWCPRARLWATRVGFTDAYGPFYETTDSITWLDRVTALDRAMLEPEAV